MYKNLIAKILVSVISLLTLSLTHAEKPLWVFSAPNPVTVNVPDNATKTVQYTVTNQSTRPKDLVLNTTIPGLSASPCHLEGQGSACNVIITIQGSSLPDRGIQSGPVLCQSDADGSPNPNQCYQPSPENMLNITHNPLPPPTVQLAPSAGCGGNADVIWSFSFTTNPVIESGHITNSSHAVLGNYVQASSMSGGSFNGTYVQPYVPNQPPNTVIGSYGSAGDNPSTAAGTTEFFVLFNCTTREVLFSCTGPYGTCPTTALAGLELATIHSTVQSRL